MNSDYLRYAHDHLQTVDNGVTPQQQQRHMDMAGVLALMSIADSLVKMVGIFERADALIEDMKTETGSHSDEYE